MYFLLHGHHSNSHAEFSSLISDSFNQEPSFSSSSSMSQPRDASNPSQVSILSLISHPIIAKPHPYKTLGCVITLQSQNAYLIFTPPLSLPTSNPQPSNKPKNIMHCVKQWVMDTMLYFQITPDILFLWPPHKILFGASGSTRLERIMIGPSLVIRLV